MAKKLLALLLVLTMVIGLVACGETPVETQNTDTQGNENPNVDQTTEVPTPTDPSSVHFTVMLETSLADATEMPIIQVLEETTGYSPEYLEVSPAASAEQSELLWLEEELPNVVMFGLGSVKINSLANEGLIVDLAPYMTEEIMPNMHKYLQDHEWDAITDAEGHIYFFPGFIDCYIDRSIAVNQEWLDTLNLKVPNTPEELMEVWRAFKTGDPNGNGKADEIPFTAESMGKTPAIQYMDPMFGMFGTVGGWQVDDEGNVFFGQTTEDYKEGIKFFRQAYAEGLIDPEIFTQDMASFTAKAQSDPLTYGSVMAFVYSAYTRCFSQEDYTKYTSILPMQAEDGNRYWLNPGAYPSKVAYKMVVTAETDPAIIEAICRWVDYMYDPHLGAQLDQAPLGIGCVDNGDGTYSTGDGVCPDADLGGFETYADWRTAMHTQAFPFVLTSYSEGVANYRASVEGNPVQAVYESRNIQYREGCTLSNYMVQDSATEEETETTNMYKTEFDSYWRSTVSSWITGNGDVDAEWDQYIETLKAMGLEELTAVYQARYDRAAG